MLILLGTIGLLQSTILPGLLIRKAAKLRGGFIESLLSLFPLSLIANYLIIFLLVALHLYTRPIVLVLITAEFFAILWLCRKTLLRPIGETFARLSNTLQQELHPLSDFLTNRDTDRMKSLKGWIWILSGCFALSGVIWALHLVRLNFGTIFSGWDTLFSWNNYARIWASGRIPNIGGMYPQLITSNWSLSYLLQGEDAVQFFNTLLPPLFFLMIQLMLFDLGFQRRKCGFFFAAVIARYMMKKLMGDQLFDGYMDVPAAAMCLLSIYTFLKAEDRSLSEQRQAIFLGFIFAAGAAVTKQSGFIVLLTAPFAVMILLRDAAKTLSGRQKLALTAIVLLIVLPWYLHCFLYNTHGYDRELIAEGIMDYNRQFNASFRIRQAINTLGKYGACFIMSLIGLPLVPKRYRLLFSLMIWPLTVIWAVSYSYDARNIAPTLPFVSIVCGLAAAGFGSLTADRLAEIGFKRLPLAALIALVTAGISIFLLKLYPDSVLIEDQRVKQKALFGEQLNRELLYGVFGESHTGNDIYTDYPAYFLPGFEDCCSAAELTDTFQVQKVLEEDKINWMMLPVIMPNNTDPSKELIEQCIAEGKCEQIRCSDGYYKAYCLYQIHR